MVIILLLLFIRALRHCYKEVSSKLISKFYMSVTQLSSYCFFSMSMQVIPHFTFLFKLPRYSLSGFQNTLNCRLFIRVICINSWFISFFLTLSCFTFCFSKHLFSTLYVVYYFIILPVFLVIYSPTSLRT